MPASAAGNAEMMRNGSSHDWKFTTISRYTSRMDMARPPISPMYDLYMVSLCPRRMKLEPRGRSFLWSGDDLLHSAGDRAEVGAVDVGEDVDDGLDVVVADGAEFGAGLDVGDISEHLHGAGSAGSTGGGDRGEAAAGAKGLRWQGAAGGTGDGQALQVGNGVEVILRGLSGDAVADAVAWIEKEVGRWSGSCR